MDRKATIDLLGLGARELEKAVGKSVLIFHKGADRPAIYIEKVLRVDGRALVGQNALSLPVLDDQNQVPRATPLAGNNVGFARTYDSIRYGESGIMKGLEELHEVNGSWIRYLVGLQSGEQPLRDWVNPIGRDRAVA